MSRTRMVVLILALAVIVVHACMMMLYSFREKLPVSMALKVDRYCVPMFYQNWKLFAPDVPTYDTQLEFRVAHEEEWSMWGDASGQYGYGTHDPIETVEQGFAAELLWQAKNNLYRRNDSLQWDAVTASQAYVASIYYVYKMEEYNRRPKPARAQLRIVYTQTPVLGVSIEQTKRDTMEFPIYTSE